MKKSINHFWNWYEENLKLNIGVALFLFLWQLLHLGWLSLDTVLERLLSTNIITVPSPWESFLIFADYIEIPAIISISLIYVNDLRKKFNLKSIFFLILLNSQWLHLFWITDEYILNEFKDISDTILPLWLAWVAILIDYLEIPVMYDTAKKFLKL